MKEQILSMMKSQIHQAIDSLEYGNLEEQWEIIRHCFTILESTKKLPDLPFSEIESDENSSQPSQQLPESSTTPLKSYRFERKIKGGFLPEIEAFVPEKVVRDLHLCHGDKVYAKLIKNRDNKPSLYEYSVAERNNGEDPEDRIQINYAIVEYDSSIRRFVCQKMADGTFIRYDDAPYTAMLLPEDVQELQIERGDVVDIAFSKTNPNYVRVLWKYPTNSLISIPSSKDPKHKNTESETEKKETVSPVFQGKRICVVGFEPGKDAFRTEVEKRGGEFLWISGNEPEPTVASTLGKADAVVMLLRYVSHHSTNYAVDYCKQHGIPFDSMQTLGRSSFVSTVESLLKKN